MGTLKNAWLERGKLAVKLAVTAKFATDTFIVAMAPFTPPYQGWQIATAVLDVIVIDLFFGVMWLLAAYSGASQQARALRPAATLAAWVMYAAMWVIAGATGNIASLVARVTGGIALAVDTWEMLAELRRLLRREAEEVSVQELWDRIRQRIWKRAYRVGLVLTRPYTWYLASRQALRDLAADLDLLSYKARTFDRQRQQQARAAELTSDLELPEGLDIFAEGERFNYRCQRCGRVGQGYETEGRATGSGKAHLNHCNERAS